MQPCLCGREVALTFTPHPVEVDIVTRVWTVNFCADISSGNILIF